MGSFTALSFVLGLSSYTCMHHIFYFFVFLLLLLLAQVTSKSNNNNVFALTGSLRKDTCGPITEVGDEPLDVRLDGVNAYVYVCMYVLV